MKLSKKALGYSIGTIWGGMIFLLTNYLVVREGTHGEHVLILRVLFFGYRFNFLGSLIGFFWGAVYGFITGWLIAFFCNLFIKISPLKILEKTFLVFKKTLLRLKSLIAETAEVDGDSI